MQHTNTYGIKSKSVINALTYDDYDMNERPDNVISCTELIDAPKAKILNHRHRDEVEKDVSDNFWLLDGSAIHYALEMSVKKCDRERLTEERIFIEITTDGKVLAHTLNKGEKVVDAKWYSQYSLFVTVKFDNYDFEDQVIEDYKRTQVWEVVFGLKESRMQQLNIGAYALKLLGFPVKTLRSCLFLKSWDKKDYERDLQKSEQFGNTPKYPPIQYAEFEEKPWEESGVLSYIKARGELHMNARRLEDDEIPPCTKEERWLSDEAYAVMKYGNQKASKVFKVTGGYTAEETESLAATHMATLMTKDTKGKYYVEHRPGINKRCEGYCAARQFCNFWKSINQEK